MDLCAQLVRIPSPNPPGDTRDLVRFVVDDLRRSGLEPTVYAPKEHMPNIVAALGGRGSAPNVVLNAHLDTFPASPVGWRYPPFGGVVADGKVWGRGVSDMKGGVAAALFIARVLGSTPPASGRITFSFSSDEETGGTWGTRWLLDNVSDVKGDACIIGDQLGTWAVGVAEKGIFWMRLTATGRPGHAAYGSRYSANAKIVRAASVALSLARPVRLDEPEFTALIERQRPEMHRWGDQAHEVLDRITVNVGRIEGGISPNLVAADATAEIDIRLPVGQTAMALQRDLRDALDSDGLTEVEITPYNGHDPSYTPTSHALVQSMLANTAALRGAAALPVVRLGASDARIFRAYGVPTVVYGPEAYNMGGIDEFITIDDLVLTTMVHAGVALDLIS